MRRLTRFAHAVRPVPPATNGLLMRARLLLLVALVILTAGAWGLTGYQVRTMDMAMGIAATDGADSGMAGMSDMASSGMAAASWSPADAATFLMIWTVMMAGMMLPAAAPMILTFDAAQARRRGHATFVPTWVFLAGYLLVWIAAGAAVYALVVLGSDLATRLDAVDRETWAPPVLGATLVTAGLYQLTSLKRVCLGHCRSPLGFVMGHWREGRAGALRMGIEHGGYCLGCCWALFAVLVAAGTMSLAWMILLTLLIFVEKVFPLGPRVVTLAGAALVLLGLVIATGLTPMPWQA